MIGRIAQAALACAPLLAAVVAAACSITSPAPVVNDGGPSPGADGGDDTSGDDASPTADAATSPYVTACSSPAFTRAGHTDSVNPTWWHDGRIYLLAGVPNTDLATGWQRFDAADFDGLAANASPNLYQYPWPPIAFDPTTPDGSRIWPEAVLPDPKDPNALIGFYTRENPVCPYHDPKNGNKLVPCSGVGRAGDQECIATIGTPACAGIPTNEAECHCWPDEGNPATTVCHQRTRSAVGAMRSSDNGDHWQDLGRVLDSPVPDDCSIDVFAPMTGGVGDEAIAEGGDGYVYLFATNWSVVDDKDCKNTDGQGIVAARISEDALRNGAPGPTTVQAFYFDRTTGAFDVPGLTKDAAEFAKVPPLPRLHNDCSWHCLSCAASRGFFDQPTLTFDTVIGRHVLVTDHYTPAGEHDLALVYFDGASLGADPTQWSGFDGAPSTATFIKPWKPEWPYPQTQGLGPDGTDRLSHGEAMLFLAWNETGAESAQHLLFSLGGPATCR